MQAPFRSITLKLCAGMRAGADVERAAEVSGAWLVLAQIAALDPSAPSWEFLQVRTVSLCNKIVWCGQTLATQHTAPGCSALHRFSEQPHVQLSEGFKMLGSPNRALPSLSPR